MKHTLLLLYSLFIFFNSSKAQNPQILIPGTKILSDSIPKNGTIDRSEDMVFRAQVPFKMPDGVNLQTDIYLPIFQDDMNVDFDLFGNNYQLTILKKGTQYLIYDSLNGHINPNPFQLPMIFTRTPYNKRKADDASLITLLGYTGAVQDLRGRFESDGVFFPLYSDSWVKRPYYPDIHLLDISPANSVHHPETFEDGANSIEIIKNNLVRTYDLNGDGVIDTTDLVYSGAIGMFGASALGYSQIQAAAAEKIDYSKPGLKAILPIVATGEFQKSTLFPNGTYRESLVNGWLGGQMADLDDNLQSIDHDIQNNIHTSLDFGLSNKLEVAERAIDNHTTRVYSDGKSGVMPNGVARRAIDISYAPVDENGKSDLNGQYSRYTNMEVPSYYLSGWWDIFVDGTIETFMKQKHAVSDSTGNKKKIKLVIGPWSHQTISSTETGDAIYPDNVMDVIGANVNDFGDDVDLSTLVNSELFNWYRYNLNYVQGHELGSPKFFMPKAEPQQLMSGVTIQIPYEDYVIPLNEMINFMMGTDGLKKVPIAINLFGIKNKAKRDIPKLDEPLIDLEGAQKVGAIETKDFTQVPPVRFYVVGPEEDGISENEHAGNYWFGAEEFPLTSGISYHALYLNGDSTASFAPPTTSSTLSYLHDPDNPVIHLGGNNLFGKTPVINKDNVGQIDYANPTYKPYVLDNPSVLTFESAALADTLSVIGFPKARIFAKANPEGADAGAPTDIDFFVRILDVYPDGREMFVADGGVNARAREYARSIAEDAENIDAPYTNIESGKLYEYFFNTLPIGYTFGKEHKIKIVLSSSNYNHYQSNPCIPLNDGEFFRRKPNEAKTYIFNGTEMSARKSVQQIFFSPDNPSEILLPVYGSVVATPIKNHTPESSIKLNVYPNPTKGMTQVYLSEPGEHQFELLNIMGQTLQSFKSSELNTSINMERLAAGAYILNVRNTRDNTKTASIKLIKE